MWRFLAVFTAGAWIGTFGYAIFDGTNKPVLASELIVCVLLTIGTIIAEDMDL